MDQLQMVIDALRNSGGMAGQAAQQLGGRGAQIDQAIGGMPPQGQQGGMPPQGVQAPQMQDASTMPNAQGLTPFQLYQMQQAQQGR